MTLTILALMHQVLGFFNVESKLKGRIYTVLAFFGDWYILYLATQYLKNHAWIQGVGLAVAWFFIMYFVVINFVYYYTDKQVKWDVSPKFAKIIPEEAGGQAPSPRANFVPANGLYQAEHILPAVVHETPTMTEQLTQLMTQLADQGLVNADYGQLDEAAQKELLATSEIVYANHPGTPLPYFRLDQQGEDVIVYGGLNEMGAQPLALVDQVGLQPVAEALATYQLFVANAQIVGGVGHVRGRAGLTTQVDPYHLKIELAYSKRD